MTEDSQGPKRLALGGFRGTPDSDANPAVRRQRLTIIVFDPDFEIVSLVGQAPWDENSDYYRDCNGGACVTKTEPVPWATHHIELAIEDFSFVGQQDEIDLHLLDGS